MKKTIKKIILGKEIKKLSFCLDDIRDNLEDVILAAESNEIINLNIKHYYRYNKFGLADMLHNKKGFYAVVEIENEIKIFYAKNTKQLKKDVKKFNLKEYNEKIFKEYYAEFDSGLEGF